MYILEVAVLLQARRERSIETEELWLYLWQKYHLIFMENEDKFKGVAELGGSKECMVIWCLFLFDAFWFASGMG